MQQDGSRQAALLRVDDAVVYDDRQPDLEEHREQPLQYVHGRHAVIEGGSGLHGGQRCGSGLLRDLQGTEGVFCVPPGKQNSDDKIDEHGRKNDGEDLDPAVTDPVQDRILTGAVLFQQIFQNDMPSALLKYACRHRSVEHVGCGAPFKEAGNGIVRDDAEIVHAKLQHAGRDEKADGAKDEPAEPCLLLMLPAPVQEEGDGDRDHQKDRDDQSGDAAFAEDDLLKLRHAPSPPQTSMQ